MNGKMLLIMRVGAVFAYLLLISIIMVKLQQIASTTLNFYPYIIFGQFAYFPVGFLLGLPKFLYFWRGEGEIRPNKSLWWFCIFPCLYFLSVPYLFPFDSVLPLTMVANASISPVVQVILGYAFASGFYKE